MSRRNQDRLSQQAKQIETLFRDFKKMLGKCRQLAQQLHVELPNDALYATIQRTTLMKVNLLDLPGLVNLKNSIAKTTSELFDQERDLAYKKQKQEVKQRIEKETLRRRQSTERKKEIQSPRVIPPQRPAQSLDSLRSSRTSDIMRQSKSIEIPIYKAKVETAEGKMDRISKYIASLKKNIKANADAAGSKWRVRDYLLAQPTYLKARTLLERYMMREEEIERVLAQAVRSKLQQFFSQSNTVTSDDNFYYVKVKKPPSSTQQLNPTSSPAKQPEKQPRSAQRENENAKLLAQASPVQKQAEADFEQMRGEIERKSELADMFLKMNEEVESGTRRLNQIREKRKQAFQQDEDSIWDEL